MKKHLLKLAALALAVVVVGRFAALPSIAQTIRAALVRGVDEPGRIPYLQSGMCFMNGMGCDITTFPAVPPNKRLVLQRIDGNAYDNAGIVPVGMGLDINTACPPWPCATNYFAAALIFPLTKVDSTMWVTHQSVQVFYEAGQKPVVTASLPTALTVGYSGSANATLSGYLIDLTQ